jgi:ATP-binding cassette subfamily B protein
MLGLIGSNLVVIYFGGVMYIDGRLKSIGTIVEFILYVNMLLGCGIFRLDFFYGTKQKHHKKRLNEFLKIEPEIKNKTQISPL